MLAAWQAHYENEGAVSGTYLTTSFGDVEGHASPWNVVSNKKLRNVFLLATKT